MLPRRLITDALVDGAFFFCLFDSAQTRRGYWAHAGLLDRVTRTQPRRRARKNIGSAKEARMGSSYLMTIVALGALGVLIVLLGRLALLTFSTWLDQ